MSHFGMIDWLILAVYFGVLASIGPLFARKNKSTETFFTGNREFPAWLLGLAMFATSISSITVVAFPGDAYKTGYLRVIGSFMLPFGIYIASKVFLPYFRRNRCTSAFEFLETRFGPGVRTYVSCCFLLGQVLRISTILYLVSLVFEQMTGQDPHICIVAGGIVIGIYTVMGGIKAIVWTQFVQTFVLWFGAILCFITVITHIDGGLSSVISTAMADHKFMLGDLNTVTKQMEPAPFFSLSQKCISLILLGSLLGWIGEYSGNQNVIQKYVSAKNPKEATKSIWICCFCSVPTWCFFMFLGTCIYVYFKQHPSEQALAILTGTGGAKPESILPYFCVSTIPTGLLGLVIAGILSAAMSASASSVNSISAVGITDIYRRHLATDRNERHYVTAARCISALSVLLMIGGAVLYRQMNTLTLQDLGIRIGNILGGGIFGLYVLGFMTTRGNGRNVAAGIIVTWIFSIYMAFIDTKVLTADLLLNSWHFPQWLTSIMIPPIHTYYVGLVGNIILFMVAYGLAFFFEAPRPGGEKALWQHKDEEPAR